VPPVAAPSSPAPALASTPAPAVQVAPAASSTPPPADARPSEVTPAPVETKPSSGSGHDRAVDERTPSGREDEGERARRPFSNTRADSPQAKGEKARAQVRVSVPPADSGSSNSRWLVLSLVIAALILGGRLYFRSGHATAPDAPAAEPPSTPVAPAPSEAVPQAAPEQAAAPSATTAAPEASAAASAAPTAEAAPSAAASANGAPSTSASAAPDGTRVVIVKISPPGARLFHKGKPVGASPVTIELAPGEKRAYEVGMPGWVTRRLVVDGSKPEMFIGLKPEK